ncbi:MAG: cob(I)yrinic acid a,c-diamide adenosyltransferase [Desulfobacteraceae bacterium]|nr:cob(I)yrinic acid a,c-diamide adenosyltransferase [Desulfobacteraceae bacterium]
MDSELLIVNTGYGKGKTTAALGLAMRALGHGYRVCIIQFMKGSWEYGELISADRFGDNLDFHVMGRGFTWQSDNIEKDRETAVNAWNKAKEIISSGVHKVVILDELTYLMLFNFIDTKEAVAFLGDKNRKSHVVVTGRDAPRALIDAADLVTEMKEVKHPYKSGIMAQKGIEF